MTETMTEETYILLLRDMGKRDTPFPELKSGERRTGAPKYIGTEEECKAVAREYVEQVAHPFAREGSLVEVEGPPLQYKYVTSMKFVLSSSRKSDRTVYAVFDLFPMNLMLGFNSEGELDFGNSN